jgi:hypothetical protein
MSLKRNAAAFWLCLILGCSEGFKDEVDELEYLSSLSRPSAAQLHRKKQLEDADLEAQERAAKILERRRLADEKRRHAIENGQEARKAMEDAAKAAGRH